MSSNKNKAEPNTKYRKIDHIWIALQEGVETGNPCFDDIIFVHNSLPECNLNKVNTQTKFFGKKLKMPLVIAAMTGGHPDVKYINKELAEIAEKKGLAMGLGSQRAMIENPKLTETYYIRDVAPNILLFGNIGISQVKQYSSQEIKKALDTVEADALCVHLNPAQEVFQTEGDIDFTNCFDSLKNLCEELPYPVIAKEVGNGISYESAMEFKKCGVRGIDVGGFGGTNWILIDSIRSGKDSSGFLEHGIPTAISILEAKKSGLPLIATGGVRNGLHIAKSIALGASVAGMARPFLVALNSGGRTKVEELVDKFQKELRTIMFLNGCKNVEELKKANYIIKDKTLEWAKQRGLIT